MTRDRLKMSIGRSAFDGLAALVRGEAGLALNYAKAPMLCSRLRPQAERLGFDDFDALARFLCSDPGRGERPALISALTTNVSQFFREPHHFETLTREVLPLLRQRADAGEPIRIWSAGCSTGQEPYSIAMSLHEAAPELCRADLLILASDIDSGALSVARAGRYGSPELASLPGEMRRRFFTRCSGETEEVVPRLREMIRFRSLNMVKDWPMRRSFDAIFCRNVIIYFDAETRDDLVRRFHGALNDGGWLFLGHSERAGGTDFDSVGATTYRARKTVTTGIQAEMGHGA